MTNATTSNIRREPTRVIGYRRVSTVEQTQSGAGLDAQLLAIEAEVARRGWHLVEVYTDAGASGTTMTGRPALAKALAVVGDGDADTLVVAKLDRLSRSLGDFARLMAAAQRDGWNLVALDLNIDLSTPAGEFLASVMASAARWEARIVSQRTRDALAARRASGVRLGRPPAVPQEVIDRITTERRSGITLRTIADRLNTDSVPTAQGGRVWHASTVRALLLRSSDEA